jgi:hypothetical protein
VDLHVTEDVHFMQFLKKYKIGFECEFDEGLQLGPLEGMKWLFQTAVLAMELQVGLSFLINISSHGPNPRCHFERIAVYRIQILCIEAMLDLINVMTLMITVVMYSLESL